MLYGALFTLGSRVINGISEELAASAKPYQLSLASKLGLRVPRTAITTNCGEIRRFYDEHEGRVVFKVLGASPLQMTETRLMEEAFFQQQDAFRFAPTIFQEAIIPKVDIRVTVVDHDVFAASIHPACPEAGLDWRLDPAAEMRPYELPEDIQHKVLMLQQRLGLRYGAIDMCLTPDGEHIFLEVNPSGQFLFVEIHANRPISSALAGALVRI
jgi:glutathione synthase/RimK-type ligase-like ATP-grasp enzyme